MQAKELIEKFGEVFGTSEGVRVFFSPGRVNLIGEHTDYNGGHVFPCALTLGTMEAVRARSDRKLRFFSMNFPQGGVTESSLDDLTPTEGGHWTDYPKGVMWAFEKRGYAFSHGLDVLIWGDIPAGSGLSSSASLEVVTGAALRAAYGFSDLSNADLAQIGQYSENNFNGMNCGIMDQFASAMGKKDNAIFLDTNTMEFEYVPVVLADAKVVITNSKVKHSLVDSAYNDRRSTCEAALKLIQTVRPVKSLGELSEAEFRDCEKILTDPVMRKRAKHAVLENQRTIRAVAALKKNDIEAFGQLMNESHISLRDDYEVSCEEVDFLAEEAWQIPGVLGSRITGGGFGGCSVSIVKDEAIPEFIEKIGKAYEEKFGIRAEFYTVEIGDGVHEIV